MSNDAVARFLDTLDDSSELRDELGAALEGKDEQAPAIVEVAGRHGFEFNEEEFNVVLELIAGEQGLSEDELDAVAGGAAPVGSPPPAGTRQFRNFYMNKGLILFKN
jgi:predicted ribosomally synthesized peptide with nif11-like leader